MENKLCIVTGATSGIGKAAALKLADRGAYLILLSRNEEKARRIRDELIAQTANTGIEIMLADFSYLYEIREVAEQILAKFNRIDVLINNAGMMAAKREETLDGIERTIAVNHMAPFLLTNLLLPALKAAKQARIINVSSEAHRLGASIFNAEDLQLRKNYSPMKAYGLSKLYNIMFTHELAKRLKDTAVTANAMHPGLVNTGLARQAQWYLKLIYLIGGPFMRSPASGAETILYLATSEDAEKTTGKYFKRREIYPPASLAFDDTLSALLWEKSEQLTGLD